MGSGQGDRLARGQAKAAFPASEKTSQATWDAAFADYEPSTYIQRAEAAEAEARKAKADRIAAEAAEAEKLNAERLERSAAEKLSEIADTSDEVSRFGSRFDESK